MLADASGASSGSVQPATQGRKPRGKQYEASQGGEDTQRDGSDDEGGAAARNVTLLG